MQLTRRHTQRLRQMLRSAGWPMLDVLEAELLTAGLLQRVPGSAGAATLRVTDAGLAAIAASAVSNRAALSAHEALVQRVAAARVEIAGECVAAIDAGLLVFVELYEEQLAHEQKMVKVIAKIVQPTLVDFLR